MRQTPSGVDDKKNVRDGGAVTAEMQIDVKLSEDHPARGARQHRDQEDLWVGDKISLQSRFKQIRFGCVCGSGFVTTPPLGLVMSLLIAFFIPNGRSRVIARWNTYFVRNVVSGSVGSAPTAEALRAVITSSRIPSAGK